MELNSRSTTAPIPLCAHVTDQRCFFLDLRGRHRRSDLTLVYGGSERCEPDYFVHRNGFQFLVFELVSSGEGRVILDGVSSPLRAGSVFAYGAKTLVDIQTDRKRPMSKYFLCFTGAPAVKRLALAGVPVGRVRQLALFREAQQLIEEIIREGRHERYATTRICTALAEVLFIKIEELSRWSASDSSDGEEEFLSCCAMIDRQFLEIKSLEEIAHLAGASSVRICRLFRRYKGISPYQYLLRRKMAFAAELLLGTGCRVKEAAERVGFADPYHFSRCFKAVHRLSPKQFQRSVKRDPGGE
jgi:AraC-like DNA-binding protein